MFVKKHGIRALGNDIAEDEDADKQHEDNSEEIGERGWFSLWLIRSEGYTHSFNS